MRRIVFGMMLTLMMTALVLTFYDVKPIESSFEFGTDGSWVWVRDTITGAWGEAVVGTGDAIYIAKRSSFYLYNSSDNSLTDLAAPPNPDSGDAFKTGTALAWDFGDYIYTLYGAATVDSRRWFYRYNIALDSWEALTNTTADQGEGDAMTWVGADNCIYATIGGEQRATYFMRYDPSADSWSDAPADPPEGMGDGASIVWAGGDFLYALRGEDDEVSPLCDFWRYSLIDDVWIAIASIPADAHSGGGGGVGDGGSLLYAGFWLSDYENCIYALSGNQAHPDSIPDNRTYRYTISANSWERLADLPFGVGYYVGCRLGYADGHIYAWQGTPSTWIGGGDDLAKYEFAPTPRTWIVDDDGPADFDTIQEAINAADPGDTIFVHNGTYCEHVVVNKTVSLIGENRSTTIIDGQGVGTVVRVVSDFVIVNGFTMQNGGVDLGICGIILDRVKNCTVDDNIMKTNMVGIYLLLSDNNTVELNNVNNNGFGVYVCLSNNNVINANGMANNEKGMYLLDSVGNTLSHNNMTDNAYNFDISGENLSHYINDIDATNTVGGRVVCYLINKEDLVLNSSFFSNVGYIAVVNSTRITVEGLNLTRNSKGILLAYTDNSTVKNVNVTNNFHGIYLFTSTGNTFTNNRASGNVYGLELSSSSNNTFVGNTMTGNNDGFFLVRSSNNTFIRNTVSNASFRGIYLSASSNNVIYHNNFVNNTNQAIIEVGVISANTWDNGFPSGGNYWSGHTETDVKSGPHQNETGSDGIVDVRYIVDANNTDNYPLTSVYHSYKVDYVEPSKVYELDLISNSTVSDFTVGVLIEHPENRMIAFNVTGYVGIGFCRICIPYELMTPPYTVLIDNGETLILYINDNLYDNSTHRWIYFTYPHTIHQVTIIPEFPSTFLAIFMITFLIATMIAKKKKICRVKPQRNLSNA